MSSVIDPPDGAQRTERQRLAMLDRLGIVDTPPESAFDDIVELARRLFRVPIAVVSFAAETRHWFKAEVGLGLREMTREASILAHAMARPGVSVVPDLAADPRFAAESYVAGGPGLRFCAAARIESSLPPTFTKATPSRLSLMP